jgi:hypothetical protein
MQEGSQHPPERHGGENPGADQVTGPGDTGRRATDVTPPVGEDAEPGQTASPAEPGEVGIPPDDEMNSDHDAETGDRPG